MDMLYLDLEQIIQVNITLHQTSKIFFFIYILYNDNVLFTGYWLFHCHFIFHIVIGMNLVLHVGTQNDLPPVPHNFPRCGDHLPPIQLH